jgi:hypothetical protein
MAGPIRDAQQMEQWMYSVVCDCGRFYIVKTGKSLEVCIMEHEDNPEEGHKILWKDMNVLRIEPNTTYRK